MPCNFFRMLPDPQISAPAQLAEQVLGWVRFVPGPDQKATGKPLPRISFPAAPSRVLLWSRITYALYLFYPSDYSRDFRFLIEKPFKCCSFERQPVSA